MADVKRAWAENYATLTTPKRNAVYTISLERRKNPRFVFSVDKGTVPKELLGKFTTIEHAIKAFEDFERTTSKSPAVKRDEWQEERRAKLSSKDD